MSTWYNVLFWFNWDRALSCLPSINKYKCAKPVSLKRVTITLQNNIHLSWFIKLTHVFGPEEGKNTILYYKPESIMLLVLAIYYFFQIFPKFLPIILGLFPCDRLLFLYCSLTFVLSVIIMMSTIHMV